VEKKRTVIDSNVFLRYFMRDLEEQAEGLTRLREKARKKEIELILLPIVVMEVGWVLEKFYKLSREKVCDYLEAIVSIPEIKLIDEEVIQEALRLYKKGVKLGDAFIIAWSKEIGAEKIWTFDRRDFKKAGFPYDVP
jgi:predicted nucleic acid-binding protein